MKHLLVPLNLRSDFVNVLDYACSLADRAKAKLTFFYVVPRRALKGVNTFVLHQNDAWEQAEQRIRSASVRNNIAQVILKAEEAGLDFRFKLITGSPTYSIIRETNTGLYDLLLMGSHSSSGWFGNLRSSLANRVMSDIQTPVIVAPARKPFLRIEHISYAVDLTDYDPKIVQTVKEIAGLFDAKLTIVHINESEEDTEKEIYRNVLESMISATLDYPKIYYKFFDHADPLGGIRKFVSQNNANLIAMTNRKKMSWGGWFSSKSLTQKMTRELEVPLLAFRKEAG
ncbi:MAG: universal stress protein [Bacteroidia bacterium]